MATVFPCLVFFFWNNCISHSPLWSFYAEGGVDFVGKGKIEIFSIWLGGANTDKNVYEALLEIREDVIAG